MATIENNKLPQKQGNDKMICCYCLGDYGSAIETLVTAISLIKQSKVAGDERAKVLIGSLQDCLHGIEEKSFGSGGSSGYVTNRLKFLGYFGRRHDNLSRTSML